MLLSPGFLGIAAVVLLLVWALADVKSMLRADRTRAALSIEGNWEELTRHFEAALRCRRPFVLLLRAGFTPGIIEAQFANHLYSQGRLEAGLAVADRAVAKSAGRPPIQRAALATRVQILTGLGRYDEARAAVEQGRSLGADPPLSEVVAGLLELYLGRPDEALKAAQAALGDPRTEDPARMVASAAHRVKGEFREAVAVLLYSPADIRVFYSADEYRRVTRVPEGAQLVALLREEREGVVQPSRYLAAVEVYLDQEDWNGAVYALGRAEGKLGRHLALLKIYEEFAALTCAGEKDLAGVERHLNAARELLQRVGGRAWTFDHHVRTGRARFILGRFDEAIAELAQAEKLWLHPFDKHAVRYWIGRAHEAAGRREEAVLQYRAVAADGFATWMGRDAAARS